MVSNLREKNRKAMRNERNILDGVTSILEIFDLLYTPTPPREKAKPASYTAAEEEEKSELDRLLGNTGLDFDMSAFKRRTGAAKKKQATTGRLLG